MISSRSERNRTYSVRRCKIRVTEDYSRQSSFDKESVGNDDNIITIPIRRMQVQIQYFECGVVGDQRMPRLIKEPKKKIGFVRVILKVY